MKYNVGDEVYIKGQIVGVGTNNPYDAAPIFIYQLDIGEMGTIVVSESKLISKNKLFKEQKTIDAKEFKKGHWK